VLRETNSYDVPGVSIYRSSWAAGQAIASRKRLALFKGDCLDLLHRIKDESVSLTVTSPPYFIGKSYDTSRSIKDFIALNTRVFGEVARVTAVGGSICWQVGYHIGRSAVVPLDYLIHTISRELPDIRLRNRIVWTFNHGLNSSSRFSGRHEMVLWFTKGEQKVFNLDSVRIPQKYPGKRHYKGPNKGEWSGNPLGKNPGDVWEMPNVNANHVEKEKHPCQFPVSLPRRLIRALTLPGDSVLDPFAGTGSTGVAAVLEGRYFFGAELRDRYVKVAGRRITQALNGDLVIRPDGPTFVPSATSAVARRPPHFASGETYGRKKES
jgi:adenine-specific DNA-methyltransferase